MVEVSRRAVLSWLGAAAGVGAVGVSGATSAGAATAPAGVRGLVLHGSQLRVLGAKARARPGSTRTVRGTLSRELDGPAQGEFFSHGTVLAEHRMIDPELGYFETHLFQLSDGTITGAGTVHHDGTGRFTVTGGSGAYQAARGSYTTRQAADHSGNGEAVFTFEIG